MAQVGALVGGIRADDTRFADALAKAREAIQAFPERLKLKIGTLEIQTEPNSRGPSLFYASQVLVDGKEMERVRSITIQGDVDSAWVVRMEFFP